MARRRQYDDDIDEAPVSHTRPAYETHAAKQDDTLANNDDGEGVLGRVMNYFVSSLYGEKCCGHRDEAELAELQRARARGRPPQQAEDSQESMGSPMLDALQQHLFGDRQCFGMGGGERECSYAKKPKPRVRLDEAPSPERVTFDPPAHLAANQQSRQSKQSKQEDEFKWVETSADRSSQGAVRPGSETWTPNHGSDGRSGNRRGRPGNAADDSMDLDDLLRTNNRSDGGRQQKTSSNFGSGPWGDSLTPSTRSDRTHGLQQREMPHEPKEQPLPTFEPTPARSKAEPLPTFEPPARSKGPSDNDASSDYYRLRGRDSPSAPSTKPALKSSPTPSDRDAEWPLETWSRGGRKSEEDDLSTTRMVPRSSPQSSSRRPPPDEGDDLSITRAVPRSSPQSSPPPSASTTRRPPLDAGDDELLITRAVPRSSPQSSPKPAPARSPPGAGVWGPDEEERLSSRASPAPSPAAADKRPSGAGNSLSAANPAKEEWTWPAWSLNSKQPCIEVYVEDEDSGESRWCDGLPLQKIVDPKGKDKFLAVQYVWDDEAYEQDFEPHHVRHKKNHKLARE